MMLQVTFCVIVCISRIGLIVIIFFFNDTATTEIYTLSLHDALPISFHFRVRNGNGWGHRARVTRVRNRTGGFAAVAATQTRGRISGDDIELSKNASFSGIYIQEFISAEDSRRYNRASFCFEIFWFPLFAIPLARDRLTEK